MGALVLKMIEALLVLIQKIIVLFLAVIANALCGDGLSVSANENIAGSEFIAMIGGEENWNIIQGFFQKCGIVIAVFLVVVSIFMLMQSGFIEVKDSYISLAYRVVGTIILIFMISSVMTKVANLAGQVWDYGMDVFGNGITHGEMDSGAFFSVNKIKVYGEDGTDDSDNSFGLAPKSLFTSVIADVATGGIWEDIEIIVIIIQTLINIIALAVIGYNLIKLCVEMIRKYVMCWVLRMLAPMMCGTFASANTVNVFFSYIKMFGVELGIMILSRIWISLSLLMLFSNQLTLRGSIMILAFLSIGTKFSEIAKGLGLTSSSMGMALMDNIAFTAAGIATGVSGVVKGASAIGFQAAALTGNVGAAKVFSAGMGSRNLDAASIIQSMGASVGGQFRKSKTKDSDMSNFTDSMKENAEDLMSAARGGDRMSQDALGRMKANLNPEGKKEFNEMFGSQQFGFDTSSETGEKHTSLGDAFRENGLHLDTDDVQKFGTATGSLTMENSNGERIKLANIETGASVPRGYMSKKTTDAHGNASYTNLMGKPQGIEAGTTMKVGSGTLGKRAWSAAEVLSGVDLSKANNQYSNLMPKAKMENGKPVIGKDGAPVFETDKNGNIVMSAVKDTNADHYTLAGMNGGTAMYHRDPSKNYGANNTLGEMYAFKHDNGQMSYKGTDWSRAQLNSPERNTVLGEMQKALDCRSIDRSGRHSEFASLGFNNVSDLNVLDHGNTIAFSYDNADGVRMSTKMHRSMEDLSSVRNGNLYGNSKHGTWVVEKGKVESGEDKKPKMK